MAELISPEEVFVGEDLGSREDVIGFIANKAAELGVATDASATLDAFMAREAMGETGMTDGFAVPHCKTSAVTRPTVMVVKNGHAVEWPSFDGTPVDVAIALLVPEGDASTDHIRLLSKTAVLLMHDDFKAVLRGSNDAAAIAAAINNGLIEE